MYKEATMTEKLIYQIYYKKFVSIHELNTFLQKFEYGELMPIQVKFESTDNILVAFRSNSVWTELALEEYNLKEM